MIDTPLREDQQSISRSAEPSGIMQMRLRPSQVFLASLGFLLWVALLAFPSFTASRDLDQSWAQAYGYFLTHGLQAGVDYIFTFGPLGYFYTQAYEPGLFWQAYFWQIGFKLLLAVNLFRVSGRFESVRARAGFLLAAIVFLPCATAQDCQYCLLIVTAGILLLSEKGTGRFW